MPDPLTDPKRLRNAKGIRFALGFRCLVWMSAGLGGWIWSPARAETRPEGKFLPPSRMEIRVDFPKEFATDWIPAEIGSWQSRVRPTGRGVPSHGEYRIQLDLTAADLERPWHVSGGIVGNESELFLNDQPVGTWRTHRWYDLIPQRTLHLAPVPPGCLRVGTNWLIVRFFNRTGAGGILEGPVGLVDSKEAVLRVGNEAHRIAALRGGLEATCFLCGLAGLGLGLAWRLPVAIAGGWTFLCLSVLSLIHSNWLPVSPPEPVRNILVLVLPVLMVRFSREAAAPSPRAERLHLAIALLSSVINLAMVDRPRLHQNVTALYGLATLLVIGAQYRAVKGPLRLSGRFLLGTLLLLLVGAAFQLGLRRHSLIPWSAMWWDPMQVATAGFVVTNMSALVLEMHRLGRERERLHHRLLQAEVFQRRELGARLHDEVLQDLIYLKLRADNLGETPSAGNVSGTSQTLASGLGAAIRYLRHMMEDLQPIQTQGRSLEAALQSLEKKIRSRYGVDTRFEVEIGSSIPDPKVGETLYRAAQECVLNACKHAHCRQVRLDLRSRFPGLQLEISDDGRGFVPEKSVLPEHGLGFLRDRIAWMGGELQIDSAMGRGTRIRITCPRTFKSDEKYS